MLELKEKEKIYKNFQNKIEKKNELQNIHELNKYKQNKGINYNEQNIHHHHHHNSKK